jgi:hypothetical protein
MKSEVHITRIDKWSATARGSAHRERRQIKNAIPSSTQTADSAST